MVRAIFSIEVECYCMETPVEKKNIGPYSISQLRIAVTELFCSVDGMSLALHIVFLLCVYNV